MMKRVKLSFDYSRLARRVSSALVLASCAATFFAQSLFAQYPGQLAKKDSTPTLRAVAVLEWTGDAGKPKTSRLVPVSLFDGQQLQDAGLYLTQPAPMALATEVEYLLKRDGATIGIFDVQSAGREQGSWVGYGDWKPAPKPKQPAFAATAKVDDDTDDDKPVLRRKHHTDDSTSTSSTSSPDSDRPTLHKKPDDSSGSDSSTASAPSDPDRPVLKKPQTQTQSKPVSDDDIGHSEALPGVTDPDRPRLERGKDNSTGIKITPTLVGLPADLHQAVAVSDAKDHPDHPWNYSWASPGDETKMKSALEDAARQALGLTAPAATPPTTTTHHSTAAHKTAQPAAPAPAPLDNEQFRVFELAYNSGATLVLSATTGNGTDRKFITLIAQPGFYGDLRVLYKSIAQQGRLDDVPRMILVDAVDALADNRGELLFELRGDTQRQFALYRVLRGSAERIFVTSASSWGSINGSN